MSAYLQSHNLPFLCWLVLIWKQPPPKPFPAESVWVYPTAGITFALCWRLCLNLPSSLPPSSHINSVAFRALDDHQGKNKIWWIRTFFFLGLFFLGRTDLSMKCTLLFFKFWFVACFLGSEPSTDGLAFEAEYAVLQPRGRTSALTCWCVCSTVLGAGYVTGGENAAEVILHAYLWDFSKSYQTEIAFWKKWRVTLL